MSSKPEPVSYIKLLKDLVDELIQSEQTSKKPALNPTHSEGDTGQVQGKKKSQARASSLHAQPAQVEPIIKTWLLFANSLMSGEFLAHSEYSQELANIINAIQKLYNTSLNASADGPISNEIPDLHPVLLTIHDLCFNLRARCIVMRIQIKLQDESDSILAISTPLPHQWSNSSRVTEETKLLIDWLRQLVEGLIEMTEIDFTCHTSEMKIRSLYLLFNACTQVKRVTALRGKATTYNPFIVNPYSSPEIPYGEGILNAIQCKCSLLAHHSIFRIKHKTGNPAFPKARPITCTSLVWDESIHEETLYKAAQKAILIVNGDHPNLDQNKDKNHLFNLWKEKLYYHKDSPKTPKVTEDIKKYDEHIQESKRQKEKFFQVITKIRNMESPSTQELNNIISPYISENTKPIILPFEFLLTSMRAIERASIKEYNDIHTRVKLLGELLFCLHDLQKKYKHANQLYEQTMTFEESFFTCEPERPLPFFIASLGCKYINPDWLEEQESYYNWLLRQYRIQESETLAKHLKESFQKELETKQGEYMNTLKEQQRDYLTLLGVFAAVITLSVSLVTSFKLAESIWDYMAMLGGAYVLIGLLVIVLYLRNTTKKEEGQLTIATMNKSMVIAACLGILGVGVNGYKEIFPQDTKHGSQPTAVSPTTVNQVHIGIPKNEASIDPSQGKTPKRQTDTIAQ